jgi:hypothetical protein
MNELRTQRSNFQLRQGELTLILGCHGTRFVDRIVFRDPSFSARFPLIVLEAGRTRGTRPAPEHVRVVPAYDLSVSEMLGAVRRYRRVGGVCFICAPGPQEAWTPWKKVHDLAKRLPTLAESLCCPVLYQVGMPCETYTGEDMPYSPEHETILASVLPRVSSYQSVFTWVEPSRDVAPSYYSIVERISSVPS